MKDRISTMKLRFVTDDEAGGISLMADDTQRLLIGWAQADITPPHPVSVRGQFYARLSEKVNDPLTSTVLVVHDGSSTAVMVSCDLISISTWLEKAIRTRLKDRIRGIHSDLVCVF